MPSESFSLPFGPAICYSGYRQHQSPKDGNYPTFEQVREDLAIVARHWRYIRIYDPSTHAERVLEAIQQDNLPLQVMLGNDLQAEVNNPDCPWMEPLSDVQLRQNRRDNDQNFERMIELANEYRDLVFAVSIGNEASVEWSDHIVPGERLLDFAKALKTRVGQPVTFCENYVPWSGALEELVQQLDFLSVHTYPVWEHKTIDDALDFTRANIDQVRQANPGKPLVITEAGWCTGTNGKGMNPDNVSEELQTEYIRQLLAWTEQEQLLTFLFEAFDEPWKGSEDPLEPEKHWGLYYENRRPKPVIALFSESAGNAEPDSQPGNIAGKMTDSAYTNLK